MHSSVPRSTMETIVREAAGVPDYEFDVFLSYRRLGTVRSWVHNHFHPMLTDCLADEMPRVPSIFLDIDSIDEGEHWPEKLAWAHRRSRLVVAVWTPSYFGSRWCQAEWRTMQARERTVGVLPSGKSATLFYPITLKDGERFPAEARNVQQCDMKKWNVSAESYRQTSEYAEFERQVANVAERLNGMLLVVPDWREDWPELRPEPAPDNAPPIPRL
jgi:TIR domain